MTTASPSVDSAVVAGESPLTFSLLPFPEPRNVLPTVPSFLSSGHRHHRADIRGGGLPAVPVPVPQQRRLQDDGGAGSGRGPRRGRGEPGYERKEGILHMN